MQVPGYDVFDEQPGDAGTVARFMDGMYQAVEWASQAGVMLALENVDVPMSESIVRCMEIVRQINSVWFQIYPDMANVTGAGYDPVVELAHCADHLVAVHVKDCLPGTIRGVPFEAGIVPFDEVFRVLASMNFRGPLTVEMWADMDKTGDPVAAAACRAPVRGKSDRKDLLGAQMLLESLRNEAWKYNHLLPKYGLVVMTSGNISGRDPETGWKSSSPADTATRK